MKPDQDKTLEQLEGEIWSDPGYGSHLVKTIHLLRKKPLTDFTTGDLRILISQNCSLGYLMPMAIEVLKKNILAEGDFYEGDLFKNVLDSDINYWRNHRADWLMVKNIFEDNRHLLDNDSIHRQIIKSFEQFEKINE